MMQHGRSSFEDSVCFCKVPSSGIHFQIIPDELGPDGIKEQGCKLASTLLEE